MSTRQRIEALERAAAGGNGWADPPALFCDRQPSDEQRAELADNARRGIRQLLFIQAGDACLLNVAMPWDA